MRQLPGIVLVAALGAGVLGCGAAPRKLMYSQAELQGLLHERLGEQEAARIAVPYAADAEMVEFARQTVEREKTVRGKVDALMRAIRARALLNVRYDAGKTTTAREVFDRGRANCIAYTNLFVALARAVGLDAFYADVTERRHYVRRAGTILHVGHICAAVRDGPQTLLVDFADESRLQYIGYRIIDDVEALSSFTIMQGVDLGGLLALPDSGSFKLLFSEENMEQFRLALRIQPGFTKGLLNLGTAHALRGELDAAEKLFREAIDVDPSFAAGYTALGNMLFEQRRFEDALSLYRMATKRQKNNQFLFYTVALMHFRLQNYKDAARAARSAVRIDPEFADPQLLLGIIAQIAGDNAEAREHFIKSLALDPTLGDAQARLDCVNDALRLNSAAPASAPASASVPVSTLR